MTEIHPVNGWDEMELLRLAASAEAASEHSLAQAVLDGAQQHDAVLSEVDEFDAVPEKGIAARVEQFEILTGNPTLPQDHQIETSELGDLATSIADDDKTPVFVAINGDLAGILAVADTINATALETINRFRSAGI
ncbi:hypothetical protein BH23CHL5_BH23CHL5_24340 [soil metagenome]